MMRCVRVVVGAVLLAVLAGCTGGGQEPAGLSTVTATPSEVEPTPTPTPTPTSIVGRVLDMSDPELGIVFDDVPDLIGDEADVYNWIATYRQEYWRTLLTNEASPAFDVFTSPEIEARMEEIAANNAVNGQVEVLAGGQVEVPTPCGCSDADGVASSGLAGGAHAV